MQNKTGIAGAITVAIFASLITLGIFAAATVDDDDKDGHPVAEATVTVTEPASPTPTPTTEPTTAAPTSSNKFGLPDDVVKELYLENLRKAFPRELGPVTDDTLIGVGESACKALDTGVSVESLYLTGMESGFSPDVSGGIVGAAIVAFCDRHMGKLR